MRRAETAHRALGNDAFRRIVKEVLALDRRIRWVAFEEAGQPPRWVSRNPADSRLSVGTSGCGDELLDPLILVLAEEREEIYGHGSTRRPLRFLMLVYNDLVQIAARCGPDSHVSVGMDPATDAYALAEKLAGLVAEHGCA
jgi:hypothetical protein